MGLFARLLRPHAEADPWDDRYYTSLDDGGVARTGVAVTPETALKISAVWACNRLISQSLASIPLVTYRRLGDDGRERAKNNPVYGLLHTRPNASMTAFEFKRLLTTHAVMKGAGYARILPGPRGPVDRLVPIHPTRVTREWLDEDRVRFRVKSERAGQPDEVLTDEQVFRVDGMSWDGRNPMSVIEYARESFGLALATESHGSRLFSQGASLGVVLTHPGRLDGKQAKAVRDDWNVQHSGLHNAHQVTVLADGMTLTKEGLTNDEAQFIATREFQVADVARWFGVDLTLLQENSKATSWGTGIEQMLQAFVTFTLLPWATTWEQAAGRDLIIAPDMYFVEYLLNSLVRGDLLTRYQAYDIAIKGGWKNRNEVRRLENDNPVDGLDGYDRPLNVGDATRPAGVPDEGGSRNGNVHYDRLLNEAAERIVRKERLALERAAKRAGNDQAAWAEGVTEFYETHGAYVATSLAIPEATAALYVAANQLTLAERGPDALATWLPGRAETLVLIAREYGG